jgi:hypothetical protein
MKVLLVDIDGKIPNLALMKISKYHKLNGDIVGFNVNCPDLIYVSCIFEKNKKQALGITKFYPDVDFIFGGSGINYDELNVDMEFQKPDYDLYPSTYSQGYTTRGCIRDCEWCIVQDKEGKLVRNQHISDFHDKRFDTVMIMDNNWLADKKWFFENTDYIIDHDLKVIEHGMDIRLLDYEISERLNEMRFAKPMKFAFDHINQKEAVINGIEILRDTGINVRQNVMFYVLVGFNSTNEEDLDRVRTLRAYNTNAFIMQYSRNRNTLDLAHKVNRKWIYWSDAFYEELLN